MPRRRNINLPQISPAHAGENLSRRIVREKFEPSFLVRVESEHDYGVDGTIELIRNDANSGIRLATNRRACFQLKHTTKTPKHDGTIAYPIDIKNINYLAARPPAFYVLYVDRTKQLLFRWWQDIYNELLVSKPGWQEQSTVNVLFSRPLDKALLREIRIEIDFHANQVQLLLDGPSFVRHFHAKRIPRRMLPTEPFNDRKQELHTVSTRTIRDSIVQVLGPPESGKTELVRHYLSVQSNVEEVARRLGAPIALLAIDIRPYIGRRVLRALSYALGISKMNIEGAVDEDSDQEEARIVLLEEVLPARLMQLGVLAVVDNVDDCFDNAVDREDLQALLNSNALRNGTIITIGRSQTLSRLAIRPTLQSPVNIGSLPLQDAQDLLGALSGEFSVAAEVLAGLGSLTELLRPGIIRQSGDLFRKHLAQNPGANRKDLLSEALLDAAEGQVREVFLLLKKAPADRQGAVGPTETLFIMAIVSELRIRGAWLDSHGLSTSALRALVKYGWAEETDSYRLVPSAVMAFRKEVAQLLANEAQSTSALQIESGLRDVLSEAGGQLSDAEIAGYVSAVEESLSWLKSAAPSATGIKNELMLALMPHIVDDLVFPLSPNDLQGAEAGIIASDHASTMDAKLFSLVPLARIHDDPARFIQCLQEAIDVAIKETTITAAQLRALDIAAFVGARRHRRFKETLANRIRLIPTLLMFSYGAGHGIGTKKWAANYLLNTAALAIKVGDLGLARATTSQAKTAVDSLPLPNTPHGAADFGTLRSHLSTIEARLTTERPTKVERLDDASQFARFALANSAEDTYRVSFYLRSVSRLIEQLADAGSRTRALNEALLTMKELYSGVSSWPLAIRAQACALARFVASLSADPDERLELVKRALGLLAPAESECATFANAGDARPLLALARTTAFAATCLDAVGEFRDASRHLERARRLVSVALNSRPSAEAWQLNLRLQDRNQLPNLENRWSIDSGTASANWKSTPLYRELRRCWAWLEIQPWGSEEGGLAVWCREREWQEEGSLEQWARTTHKGDRGWEDLDNATRRATLTLKHAVRRKQLLSIKSRSGPFAELFLALARREAQYQRLMAIHGDHMQDVTPSLRYLEDAERLWPDDQSVLAEKAEVYRYMWDYPNAIRSFRKLVDISPDGERRRVAMLGLMHCLLSSARYEAVIEKADGSAAGRADLLSEAASFLPQVANFRKIAVEVAMLRDNIAFELDQEINWSLVDGTYTSVIGGVDLYVPTVIHNLHALQQEEARLAEHIADIVRQDFTSEESIRGMGSLYLRRAEKNGAVADCQRAYASFDACRICEQAFLGSHSETATTSFQRGRAILLASDISQSTDPFPAHLPGKKSLLHLGEALLQRAVSLSVGSFYIAARARASEGSKLKARLEKKPIPTTL
jgi:hypothetical protein